MVKIKEAIVVEGRYDKNTLSQIIDAPIFETGGFAIFKDKKQMRLLRQVAEKRGLIVFTDADGLRSPQTHTDNISPFIIASTAL